MRNSGKKPADDDEVEQLLRAAQDDVLLKLNLNSHTTRAAAIDPDLDRRFEALKKPPKPAQINDPARKVPPKPATGASSNSAADGDLFSRFTALKNSIPSHDNQEVKEEEESDDEVEKVIKWAIDAARLDPSPPSDGDDQSDDDDDDQSDESDDDDDDSPKQSKRK